MVERSLSIRKGLEEVTARNRDLRDLDLSDAEWALVKEAMEFLEPFALITKHVEAFKYPTLSSVIPLFNKLMDDMEEWSSNTRHSEESRAGANAALYYIYILEKKNLRWNMSSIEMISVKCRLKKKQETVLGLIHENTTKKIFKYN
ncbi:hypothetical protein OUZ56_029692 [Daphnia magna]|uniref:Zinc finger BED domain-containing-like protein n=1 Tax=Daphnia magna TaxID=35525 RepID=A0ABR0B7J8_9CRUS|nr:hypothetical protein OUZ56_029692 [Daphnia magna]